VHVIYKGERETLYSQEGHVRRVPIRVVELGRSTSSAPAGRLKYGTAPIIESYLLPSGPHPPFVELAMLHHCHC
jgi:hypothetical protein